MKLLRVHVKNFGALPTANVTFGPGLNVVFGPNDLGKSTLVEAIRCALLLPATSTLHEKWVPWTGSAHRPVVELDFQINTGEIWRVYKEYATGAGGKALLSRSKDGKNFDDVAKSRQVDGELRKILCWGVPEPGGAGAGKGMPQSFLATTLLSTQHSVDNVLSATLDRDQTGSGRERISAALQAVAQDPLFTRIYGRASQMYDKAFTATGARSRAQDGVFKLAADNVRLKREDAEKQRDLVASSNGAEEKLLLLSTELDAVQAAAATATANFAAAQAELQQSEVYAQCRARVDAAQAEVSRLGEIAANEQALAAEIEILKQAVRNAELDLKVHEEALSNAREQLKQAEDAARLVVGDADVAETVERQRLELCVHEAEQRVEEANAALAAIDAAAAAAEAYRTAEADDKAARDAALRCQAESAKAKEQEDAIRGRMARLDILERALDLKDAEAALIKADKAALAAKELRESLASKATVLDEARKRRSSLVVPDRATLKSLQAEAAEVEVSRRSLDVGLAVDLVPERQFSAIITVDGSATSSRTVDRAVNIPARQSVQVVIEGVGTISASGGSAEKRAQSNELQLRFAARTAPIFTAAGVSDLPSLLLCVDEAERLDAEISMAARDAAELQARATALGDVDAIRASALQAVDEAKRNLGNDAGIEDDLSAIGAEPRKKLREERPLLSERLKKATDDVSARATALGTSGQVVDAKARALVDAASVRDRTALPPGAASNRVVALTAVQAAVAAVDEARGSLASLAEKQTNRDDLLAKAIEEKQQRVAQAEAVLKDAREALAQLQSKVANAEGRHLELSKQVSPGDRETAATALAEMLAALNSTKAPERLVDAGAVAALENEAARLTVRVASLERDIERARGGLEQTGGAVAREKLLDAEEALRVAQNSEREIEAEYDAWRLLKHVLQEAEKAQASDLGQVLTPVLSKQFQALTSTRYTNVAVTAQLGTDGVMVSGAVREPDKLSVGTREQLATLFRLCLAEYLQSTVVLDDQLVGSDASRMDQLRDLLVEKGKKVQIVVFTCRPTHYVAPAGMPPSGAPMLDVDGIRAIDFTKAIGTM